jgi:MFS family permease
MTLSGLGIAGVAFGLSVLGLNFLPWWIVVALIGGGAISIVAYLVHARRTPQPALDLTLFRLPTFYTSVVGGFMFRMGVGALPFLLPLMLQIGFGMTPFQSGLVTFASAVGSMTMKMAAARLLRRFGFRTIMLSNALISSAFLAVCAAFTEATPAALMFVVLLIGGFFRSLEFTSINTLAYADVEPARVSRATSLVSVAQQLAISAGVAFGALAVELTVHVRGGGVLGAQDFPPAFIAVAIVSATSVLFFVRLSPHAGAELSNRTHLRDKAEDKSAA